MSEHRAAIDRLRLAGKIEAISFLVLLGIAMPLKYLADMPLAVRVVGMAHGLLFIVFIALLFRALAAGSLGVARGGLAFVAAFLPFGPFVIDRYLVDEAEKADQNAEPATD
jgi:integral membrane protein